LSAMLLAIVTRTVRSSMLEVLSEQYIAVGAKGVAERVVVFRYALRNAFIPVITVIDLRFGELLAGALVTETVFQ
jgi:peptide/nickel transport system permease protein